MLKKVVVKNQWGIHASVATALCELSMRYKGHMFIKYGKKTASIRYISQTLGLGVRCGEEIIIIADGDDEAKAMDEAIAIIQYTQ